jgi:hypothetical protein
MILSILAATSSRAQENLTRHKYISVGINGLVAIPLGDFFYESDQILPWGINGSLLFHPKKTEKWYVGLGFSYFNYGMEKYSREMEIDGILYNLGTFRNYNIYFPYFNVRLTPWDKSRLVPVFDGFIGPRAFSTVSTSFYEEDPGFFSVIFGPEEDERAIRNKEHLDWTWGYGFSVGLNYFISYLLELELTLNYTKGGEANYLTKKDIKTDPGSGALSYYPRRSESDMLTLALGVRFTPF